MKINGFPKHAARNLKHPTKQEKLGEAMQIHANEDSNHDQLEFTYSALNEGEVHVFISGATWSLRATTCTEGRD